MHVMNICRDPGGTSPLIRNLSAKQGEFQATDTNRPPVLEYGVGLDCQEGLARVESLTPAGDRTTIHRSFIP